MTDGLFVENLAELTVVADDDMLYVVDNSATGPDKDKRAPKGNLLAPIVADGDLSVVAIGGVADAESTLKLYGQELIVHTSTEADDHALELDVDAAGHGDVKVVDIDYITGTLGAGEDEGVILINIDETQATGGDIFALEVLATDGKAGIYGLKAGVLIGPVHQDAGTFDDPTTATDNTASSDVDAMKDGSTSTTTAIFEADNEYIIIGAAAAFEEMEFVLTTQSSKNIKPTFWYSTSGTGQFTQFTPVDGTDGFKHTGVVAWDASDLTGHVADGVTGTFDIKIIRTRNKIPGNTPVLGYAKTASTTEYIWDKDGDLSIRNITVSGTVDGIDIATDVAANTLKATESTTVTAPLALSTYDISIPAATNAAAGHATAAQITALEANTAHLSSDGTDHGHIDQDVQVAASPTFAGLITSSAAGIDCNPGADIDTDLITVGVTGAPLLKWDESENAFDFSTIIAIPATTSTVGQIKQNGNRLIHTYGTNNMFIGIGAGNFTLTDELNLAVGEEALAALTTGGGNIAIGYQSLENNTTGDSNVAIGKRTLRANTSGRDSFALGENALSANISGYANIAIGRFAMFTNSTGNYNVGIGEKALELNTNAPGNLAIGQVAGRRNATGGGNVFLGQGSGQGVAGNSHQRNTVIGWIGCKFITTGSNNVCIGWQTGDVITSGSNNIIIGYDIDPSGATVSHELNIGGLIMGYLSAHGSGPAIHFMGDTPQSQQAHIVDADGTIEDITTKFNTLLADLEGYGLLAAS